LVSNMIDEIKIEAKKRMELAVESVRSEFTKLRTGKASPTLLDGIQVDYYGNKTPIKQVANVSAPEPRLLVIQPWEKSLIGDIEKAILKSDLGLNPTNDGIVVRIPIPQLNEERRQALVKVAKKIGEDGKISIRNIRREANEKLKGAEKSHDISEDNFHDAQNDTQKLTDEFVKKIDELFSNKEKEVLEI